MSDPHHFLRMAQLLKAQDAEIKQAIFQVQAQNHGVVALKFTDQGRNMVIEILDEPFEENVRVFPGD